MRYKHLYELEREKIEGITKQLIEFKEASIAFQARWEQAERDISHLRSLAVHIETNLRNEIEYLRRKLERRKE